MFTEPASNVSDPFVEVSLILSSVLVSVFLPAQNPEKLFTWSAMTLWQDHRFPDIFKITKFPLNALEAVPVLVNWYPPPPQVNCCKLP